MLWPLSQLTVPSPLAWLAMIAQPVSENDILQLTFAGPFMPDCGGWLEVVEQPAHANSAAALRDIIVYLFMAHPSAFR
jgi:hypothetical protein